MKPAARIVTCQAVSRKLAVLKNLIMGAEAVAGAADRLRQVLAEAAVDLAAQAADVRLDDAGLRVEVEVENGRELAAALTCGCDVVMLDNFTPARIKKAVALRDALAPNVKLEASGGITEKTLCAYAKTKVDYISMGALTHSPKNADVSLRMDAIR